MSTFMNDGMDIVRPFQGRMDVGFVSVGCHPRLFMFFPSGEIELSRQLSDSSPPGKLNRDNNFP